MQVTQNRRRFLAALSSAGAAGLIGAPKSFAQEPAPETTAVRFPKYTNNVNNVCGAPLYVMDELLRAEGFTDIRYIATDSGATGVRLVASGEADFDNAFVGTQISMIDAGGRISMLGGLHIGCYELFANGDIRSIRDLKGRTVGVQHLGSSPHLLVSSMASYVGLDPTKDIKWVVSASDNPMELFATGQIDAFLGFPPEPQELRARKAGHVIVNTTRDRPWSQYFCCMVGGNRDSSATTPWRPSACCAPSSRPRISAPPSRPAPRKRSSTSASPANTITRCRRCRKFPMGNGAPTSPRIRCGSMRSDCAKWA